MKCTTKISIGTISLEINREIGVNKYEVIARYCGDFAGRLVGYVNWQSNTAKLYPGGKMIYGVFSPRDFPIVVAAGDLPWAKGRAGS